MKEIADFVFDNLYLLLAAAAATVFIIVLLRTLAETLFGLQHLDFVSLDAQTAVEIAEQGKPEHVLLIDFSWAELNDLRAFYGSDKYVFFDLSLRREELEEKKWMARLDGTTASGPHAHGRGSRTLLQSGFDTVVSYLPFRAVEPEPEPEVRPAGPERPWIIVGLETILMNRRLRLLCLDMLEQLAGREGTRIYFFSEVSPLARLRQAREREKLDEASSDRVTRSQAARESFRWSNLFADFTTFYGQPPAPACSDWPAEDSIDVLLNKEFGEVRSTKVFAQRAAASARARAKTLVSREAVIAYIANFLGDYYQRQWLKSTKEEHLAMHHLAHGRYINADNFVVLDNLMLRGLVRRDPDFQLMNESFAHWVRMIDQPEWFEEFRMRAERGGTWHFMRVPLLLGIVAAMTVITYLDRGGSGSLLALLPAVAAGVPLLLTQLTQARNTLGS